jgi:hypothetical protein
MSCGRVIDAMGDRDLLGCLPSIGKPASTRQVQGTRPGSTSTIKPNDIESVSDCLIQPGGLLLTEGHEVEQHAQRMHSYIPSSFCRSSTLW